MYLGPFQENLDELGVVGSLGADCVVDLLCIERRRLVQNENCVEAIEHFLK